MKWEGHEQSRNVEDFRGTGGGSGGRRLGGRGIGLGTIVIAVLAGWIFGINPLTVLSLLGGGGGDIAISQPQQTGPAPAPPAQDQAAAFVSTVLRDTEVVWGSMLQGNGGGYREPKRAIFRGVQRTACGMGQSAMGPFYCPGDQGLH